MINQTGVALSCTNLPSQKHPQLVPAHSVLDPGTGFISVFPPVVKELHSSLFLLLPGSFVLFAKPGIQIAFDQLGECFLKQKQVGLLVFLYFEQSGQGSFPKAGPL